MMSRLKFLIRMFLLGTFILFAKGVYADTILGDLLKEKGIALKVDATMDFYDKYVWRGFLLDKDAVMQPSITFSANGFEGGFWGNWDLHNKDSMSSDETDGWIGYNFDLAFINEALKMVNLSVGHTWYGFPEAHSHTVETYWGVSLDTFLSPYIKWYRDYGNDSTGGGADGSYFAFGIGHALDLVKKYDITLDLGFELGINHEAFIDGTGGYTLTTAGVNVPLTEKIIVSPKMAYSIPFADLADANDGNQSEEFYGGVSLAYGF